VACGSLLGSPGPVYWDSFDYVTQALNGDVSGLGLGRPVFALVTGSLTTLWRQLGGSVWDAEPVLRVICLLWSALAAPLTGRLGRALGLSARAAFLAAIIVATSPVMAHTSAAVLTDAPAVPLILLAWLAALRAVATGRVAGVAVAGMWWGLAIGVREGSVYAGLTMLVLWWWMPRSSRWRAAAAAAATTVVTVLVPVVWPWLTNPTYGDSLGGWLSGMAHDSGLNTFELVDLGRFLLWVAALAPVAVPAVVGYGAAAARGRALGSRPTALVVTAWIQILVLATYLGASYSPRYFLSAFPLAMAIPAAWWWDRRRHLAPFVIGVLLPIVAGPFVIHTAERPVRSVLATLTSDLAALPPDAVVVTGHACPAVSLIATQARLEPRHGLVAPSWTTVCPGWSWPVNLSATLDTHLAAGRTLVLDLRDAAWRGAEQQRSLEQLRAYASRPAIQSSPLVRLWTS
jgi:4-amino-4-deoxy-L-arabinose transferase-like glycosyltransferase